MRPSRGSILSTSSAACGTKDMREVHNLPQSWRPMNRATATPPENRPKKTAPETTEITLKPGSHMVIKTPQVKCFSEMVAIRTVPAANKEACIRPACTGQIGHARRPGAINAAAARPEIAARKRFHFLGAVERASLVRTLSSIDTCWLEAWMCNPIFGL